jgi:hypothetical protein
LCVFFKLHHCNFSLSIKLRFRLLYDNYDSINIGFTYTWRADINCKLLKSLQWKQKQCTTLHVMKYICFEIIELLALSSKLRRKRVMRLVWKIHSIWPAAPVTSAVTCYVVITVVLLSSISSIQHRTLLWSMHRSFFRFRIVPLYRHCLNIFCLFIFIFVVNLKKFIK